MTTVRSSTLSGVLDSHEVAELLGVKEDLVRRWKSGGKFVPPQEGYGRGQVIAFGLAVGLIDPATRRKYPVCPVTQGKWLPVNPTVDPSNQKLRYYAPHVLAMFGAPPDDSQILHRWRRRGKLSARIDELGRMYYLMADLTKFVKANPAQGMAWKALTGNFEPTRTVYS